MRIARCTPAEARRQAAWIAGIEPWRGLGYGAGPLGRWLATSARRDTVYVAREGASGAPPLGIAVLQSPFLLGGFIALLAVRPDAAGRGLGRALVERVARQVFAAAGRRWLYVSADARNRAALGFYRKLGFRQVGRLPDLIRSGRTELLLRRGA